jgi:hypothetical protein
MSLDKKWLNAGRDDRGGCWPAAVLHPHFHSLLLRSLSNSPVPAPCLLRRWALTAAAACSTASSPSCRCCSSLPVRSSSRSASKVGLLHAALSLPRSSQLPNYQSIANFDSCCMPPCYGKWFLSYMWLSIRVFRMRWCLVGEVKIFGFDTN